MIETGAILEGHFLLTSGRHSNKYVEKFRLIENPQSLDLVCSAMADMYSNKNINLVLGAAIGGIGVDRFKIEEVATENNIPMYAIVIKQTLPEAISIMKKEIAETIEPVHNILNRLIKERTKKGDSVIIIGVGNTAGVSQ